MAPEAVARAFVERTTAVVCAIAPAVRRPTRTFSVSVALAPGLRAARVQWAALRPIAERVPLGARLLMGATPRSRRCATATWRAVRVPVFATVSL